jgi:ABC-type antimicrobial peptide transport system ATPase subunit
MSEITINLPDGLHPDTAHLVASFACALGRKLHEAEKKYGYEAHWARQGWRNECAQNLVEHVGKGDPRDVAAYCAFMWYHGWATSLRVSA